MDYSERLQTAMDCAKKSRKALAAALGISVAAVGQVINRQSKSFGLENNNKARRVRAFLRLGVNTIGCE